MNHPNQKSTPSFKRHAGSRKVLYPGSIPLIMPSVMIFLLTSSQLKWKTSRCVAFLQPREFSFFPVTARRCSTIYTTTCSHLNFPTYLIGLRVRVIRRGNSLAVLIFWIGLNIQDLDLRGSIKGAFYLEPGLNSEREIYCLSGASGFDVGGLERFSSGTGAELAVVGGCVRGAGGGTHRTAQILSKGSEPR